MERPVPYDLAAEEAALAAVLMDPASIAVLAGALRPEQFYLERHELIYAAMLACYARRELPDLTAVQSEMRRQGTLDRIGGVARLGGVLAAESWQAPDAYARAIRDAHIRRQAIEAGARITALAYDESTPLPAMLAAAEGELRGVTAQGDAGRGWRTLAQVVEAVFADIERSQDDGTPTGTPTGYYDLDAAITALFPDQLTIIGARPSVGKTALLLSLADRIARRGRHVGICSLEMGEKSLTHRLIAMESGVETRHLRSGRRLSSAQLAAVTEAMGVLSELPITLEETPGLALHELASKARRLHGERPLSVLFVDYLQLVREPGAAREKRYLEVSAVARGLKDLSRDIGVPVVALSQLTRDAEDRIPNLSDLRESGEIEQAADNVWMLYRKPDEPGVTEVHIVKHRDGPLNVVPLRFDAQTTRFLDLARYQEPSQYEHSHRPRRHAAD